MMCLFVKLSKKEFEFVNKYTQRTLYQFINGYLS